MYIQNIEILKRLAAKSAVSHKHAACLMNGKGKIISIGVNKHLNTSIPTCLGQKTKKLIVSVHAEIDALANCHSKFYKGSDILVIRVNSKGQLLNSRPCTT